MNFYDLPRRLWWSHHLAFLCHDQLAHTLLAGRETELFAIDFSMTDPVEVASFEELAEGEAIEWLRTRGRHAEASNLMERVVVYHILEDTSQFIYESLEAAAKGKVSVAFALLRKAFRDQLFVLEWILSDREHFLQEFAKGPKHIDVQSLLSEKKGWMRTIFRKAVTASTFSDVEDPEMIFDMRYVKDVHWSLDGDWTKALHLVTTHNKNHQTEIEDLNFAVADDSHRAALLFRYYLQVPMVLLHMCGVLEAIIARWDSHFVGFGRLFGVRIGANLELSTQEVASDVTSSFGQDGLNEILAGLQLNCDGCAAPLRVAARAVLEHFVRDMVVRCSKCGHFDEQLDVLNCVEDAASEHE